MKTFKLALLIITVFLSNFTQAQDAEIIAPSGFDQVKEELPVNYASSLKQILQSSMTKESVIAAFLTELSARWIEENNASTWPTSSLVRDYKTNCITLNKKITAQLPGGELINAEAVDISQTGELVVMTDDGTRSLSSADIHLIS